MITFIPKPGTVIQMESFTEKGKWYTLNTVKATCVCRSFEQANTCKHLQSLGLHAWKPFVPSAYPIFSQALCAVEKSIRLRRISEATYWITYIERSFTESEHRFQLAKRLLQSTAEDNLSIPVMEKCVDNFTKLMDRKKTDVMHLIAEALRICKLPNWWDPAWSGPGYVRDALRAYRWALKSKKTVSVSTLKERMHDALEEENRWEALTLNFQLQQIWPLPDYAEWVFQLAGGRQHSIASRIAEVHLLRKYEIQYGAFLNQAIWHLAGGSKPTGYGEMQKPYDTIEPVTRGEALAFLEHATEAWETPHLIPMWACDGVTCAGNDVRFMYEWPQMLACCRAFQQYQRLDPDDAWLPSFQDYDDLNVQV